jgi:hypothetical protein
LTFLPELRVGDWKVSSYHEETLFLLEIPQEMGGMVLAGNFSDTKVPMPPLSLLNELPLRYASHAGGWGKEEGDRRTLRPFEVLLFF